MFATCAKTNFTTKSHNQWRNQNSLTATYCRIQNRSLSQRFSTTYILFFVHVSYLYLPCCCLCITGITDTPDLTRGDLYLSARHRAPTSGARSWAGGRGRGVQLSFHSLGGAGHLPLLASLSRQSSHCFTFFVCFSFGLIQESALHPVITIKISPSPHQF